MGTVLENTHVGPFYIVKRLGKARRQRVFHALQTEQDRDVALKFISWPDQVPWEQALDKIQREANELKQLSHPNLAKVYGAGVHEEQIFFASELIEGESLANILTRRGRLTTDLVVEYGRQIAEILRYLHSVKLVHGRLTPGKLVVTADHKVSLVDLRVCRAGRRRWDAPKRPQLEAAAYMAPEQFSEGPSARADFYALGVILYEMTTGVLPVEPDTIGRMIRKKQSSVAPSVTTHVMDCPVWLDTMVQQLLQIEPKDRQYSAKALVLAFDEIQKIDASQRGAASQIAGNFNPLTAGKDKTEARQLLNKREQPTEPFYQTVPFLVGALMLTAFAGIWMALPANSGDLVQRSRDLVESSSSGDWETVATTMEPIMESNSKYAEEARTLFDRAKRKTLVDLAKRGINSRAFHAPVTRSFVDAYQFETNEEPEKAKALYFKIVSETDPQGDKRYVYLEAKERYGKLAAKIVLPDDVEQLQHIVESVRQARTPKEMEFAQNILTKIYVEKSGEDAFEEVVAAAKKQLDLLDGRMATAAEESTPSPAASDSTADEADINQAEGVVPPISAPDQPTETPRETNTAPQ